MVATSYYYKQVWVVCLPINLLKNISSLVVCFSWELILRFNNRSLRQISDKNRKDVSGLYDCGFLSRHLATRLGIRLESIRFQVPLCCFKAIRLQSLRRFRAGVFGTGMMVADIRQRGMETEHPCKDFYELVSAGVEYFSEYTSWSSGFPGVHSFQLSGWEFDASGGLRWQHSCVWALGFKPRNICHIRLSKGLVRDIFTQKLATVARAYGI